MKKTLIHFCCLGILPILLKFFFYGLGISFSFFYWHYYIWLFGLSLIEIGTVLLIIKKIDKPSPLVFLAAEMLKMLAFMIVFLIFAIVYDARKVEDALTFGGLSVYFLALSAFILIRIVRKISKIEK